jgi:4-hydroxy-tetrahydrodipicolinate synthase
MRVNDVAYRENNSVIPWLRGVIPPVVTPFDAKGRIDQQAFQAEVEFQLNCDVPAICVGGSTGEGAGLTPGELGRLNRLAADQIRGRVPVIAGIIPDHTDEAVDLALAAKEEGAVLLQVTPTHYVSQLGVEELVSYYCEIRQRTGMEIILYNVLPWAQVTPDGVGELIKANAIIGVKQSGYNMHHLADLVYRYSRLIPILCAVDDLLYPSFMLGSQGTISAIASVLPKECSELFGAVQRGDHARALALHHQLLVIWRAIDDNRTFTGRVKYALELQGRSAGLPRHPFPRAGDAERAIVRRAFEEAGITISSGL